MAKFTVGTDIEFFLQREGQLVSAIDFIPHTKHMPGKMECGGVIIHDNVALEVATPVADSKERFVDVVRATLLEAMGSLPEEIDINTNVSSTDFPEHELEHPEARVFGCSPDFDAWKLEINQVPPGAEMQPFRCVGGHLHIGFVPGSGYDFLLDPYGKVALVKVLDILLGVPFVLIDKSKGVKERRGLYGKAGCHRPTDYGVEYRVLSNYWTASPKLVELVYDIAEVALDIVANGPEKLFEAVPEQEVVDTINNNNATKARKLLAAITPFLGDNAKKVAAAIKLSVSNLHTEWA